VEWRIGELRNNERKDWVEGRAQTAALLTIHCFIWNGMLALKNCCPQSSHERERGGGIFDFEN
jgi:hypothetical protein